MGRLRQDFSVFHWQEGALGPSAKTKPAFPVSCLLRLLSPARAELLPFRGSCRAMRIQLEQGRSICIASSASACCRHFARGDQQRAKIPIHHWHKFIMRQPSEGRGEVAHEQHSSPPGSTQNAAKSTVECVTLQRWVLPNSLHRPCNSVAWLEQSGRISKHSQSSPSQQPWGRSVMGSATHQDVCSGRAHARC